MSNGAQPAFPVFVTQEDENGEVTKVGSEGGLTKREFFAAQALPALIRCNYTVGSPEEITATAVRYADALIAELEKKGGKA
jgi:hypothetical protein